MKTLLFLTMIVSAAFPNELFRDLQFGSQVNVREFRIVQEGPIVNICERMKDSKLLGSVSVSSIRYGIINESLYSVAIKFDGYNAFQNLKKQFISKYGGTYRWNPENEIYTWREDNVYADLEYKSATGMGSALIWYEPLKQKIEQNVSESSW